MIAGRTAKLACAAAAFIPLLAQAEEGQTSAGPLVVALEYAAVPDCPEIGDFKAIVAGRLGRDPFRDGSPDRVLVQVASYGLAYEGRIEWRDAQGRWAGDRNFPSRSADCRELVRAMAFALALQIQLSGTASATRDSGAAPVEAVPTAEAAAPPPTPPPTTPPVDVQREVPAPSPPAGALERRPQRMLAVGAGALVGFGVSSGPVPFGRLFGNLAWPRWSLELAAEVGWPSTVRREDGAGFAQQVLLAGLAGCGTIAPWSACVLAKGGVIRIEGKDIDDPASPTGPLVATGLRLAVMQPLGRRLYVTAQAEGLLLVTRWRVTLDDNLVWTSPRFAGNIGMDLGVRFP